MARRFVYARELAAYLGRSGQTLYNWRKTGKGPRWSMMEGRVVYDIADVARWLRERT